MWPWLACWATLSHTCPSEAKQPGGQLHTYQMQQDIWTNTQTNVTYGITGALGSPRGWLRRALNVANLDDTTFHETSITPPEISVAGIWYQPVRGLPSTGPHRELIRWFDIPDARYMARRCDAKHMLPAVGISAAVPMNEVMHWLRVYRESGAIYTWWKTPENKSARASSSEKPARRQLDYPLIYRLLDQGLTVAQISKQIDVPGPNIEYVKKKWLAGDAPTIHKAQIDVGAVIDDYRSGMTAIDVAEKYNTSESYVYRMLRGARELKGMRA